MRYSGSHNFTVDSWGTLENKKGEYTNTIYNYELGVFFPPTTPSDILGNFPLPFQGVRKKGKGRGEELVKGKGEGEDNLRVSFLPLL